MAVLDSGGEESDVRKIMKLCYVYLSATDKSREAAAVLAARLITRPDLHTTLLTEFLVWSKQKLSETDPGNVAGMVALTGVLTALSVVFKLGKRRELLPHAPELAAHLATCDLANAPNTLLRKLSAKLVQRLGLTFLPPRVAPWRYQRGKRTLLGIGKSAASQAGNKEGGEDDDDDDDYDIPEDVEGVIEHMLTALKDKDTIVRWSAAKGIGRITGRLPLELADEVVGSVLELCSHREGHTAWHGACLALAELGRRGLLLPDRLGEVVPVVLKALSYDELRGAASVGAHVRDAACYVAWAFARAYDPSVIAVHIENIARALLVATVYDREINVRRAASAAFQENVGRQGTLPNGIEIVTEADYFAVGNRTKAYLEIAVFIAQFPQYTLALAQHLADVKLAHWDRDVRELAATALNRITFRCPEEVARLLKEKVVIRGKSIDLNTRHGNILAIGECVRALCDAKRTDLLGEDTAKSCTGLIAELTKLSAFRGSGGEMIRVAVLTMIENIARSGIAFSQEDVQQLQAQVDINLVYEEGNVQDAAVSTFKALCEAFYSDPKATSWGISEKVVVDYISALANESTPARARRGYAAAFGCLSNAAVIAHLQEATGTLVCASALPVAVNELATEARRTALKSLATVFIALLGSPEKGRLNAALVQGGVDALFSGMEDYTIDSRGDIGSNVREECMRSLEKVLSAMVTSGLEPIVALAGPMCAKIMQCLAQQAMEKIDRTRAVAGTIMDSLCADSALSAFIPHHAKLAELGFGTDQLDWLSSSETFPRTVQLLRLATYRHAALTGLVVSVGGLTESLVKHSSSSLLEYLGMLEEEALAEFGNEILDVFRRNQGTSRITIPTLKCLDLLFCHGTLEDILANGELPFAQSLLDLCKSEITKCSDVKKLNCAVDVLCGVLAAPDPVRKSTLNTLMRHLCHKYPRVRKFTAEKLYLSFMSLDEAFSEDISEEVSTILTETLWDDELKAARVERNKICDLLGLPLPKLKAKAAKAASAAPAADELDSYRDLVERTGY